jgi:hypothetical protein
VGELSPAQEEIWVSVLGPLYKAVEAARPGSLDEKIAERALDYAINTFEADPSGGSNPSAFAIHDHLRHARHNALRADKREALGRQRLVAASTASGATRVLGPVEYRGPEDCAVADDLLQRLRVRLGSDARVAAVLDGMLQELPSAVISSLSGIPLRTVERLRADIRATYAALVAA